MTLRINENGCLYHNDKFFLNPAQTQALATWVTELRDTWLERASDLSITLTSVNIQGIEIPIGDLRSFAGQYHMGHWKRRTYKVGQRFKHTRTGNIYLLAKVGENHACLINVESGFSWNEGPEEVNDLEAISLEEFSVGATSAAAFFEAI